jgi:hypothetical protein
MMSPLLTEVITTIPQHPSGLPPIAIPIPNKPIQEFVPTSAPAIRNANGPSSSSQGTPSPVLPTTEEGPKAEEAQSAARKIPTPAPEPCHVNVTSQEPSKDAQQEEEPIKPEEPKPKLTLPQPEEIPKVDIDPPAVKSPSEENPNPPKVVVPEPSPKEKEWGTPNGPSSVPVVSQKPGPNLRSLNNVKKEEELNPEFPQLGGSPNNGPVVSNGPGPGGPGGAGSGTSGSGPPTKVRSWASIASSKLANANGPTNGLLPPETNSISSNVVSGKSIQSILSGLG